MPCSYREAPAQILSNIYRDARKITIRFHVTRLAYHTFSRNRSRFRAKATAVVTKMIEITFAIRSAGNVPKFMILTMNKLPSCAPRRKPSMVVITSNAWRNKKETKALSEKSSLSFGAGCRSLFAGITCPPAESGSELAGTVRVALELFRRHSFAND